MTYFYTTGQIDENFESESIFSDIFSKVKTVEIGQYVTWILTTILGGLSIFSIVRWCIPMVSPKKSQEIEMVDLKDNKKRRTYRKIDTNEK
jgi:hypothetical protein